MEITQPNCSFLGLAIVLGNLREGLRAWSIRQLLSDALMQMVHHKLLRAVAEITRLAALFRAGKLRRLALRAPVEAAEEGAARCVSERIWPCRFGWLVRLMEWKAMGYSSQLQHLLGQPEMVALLLAAPQAARALRPVCRMLMIDTKLLKPRPADDDEIAVVKVRKKAVRRPREVVVHLRPLQPWVLAAARAWPDKKGG